MNNIWFTSDTHYHHKNIVRGTTSWDLSRLDGSSHVSVRNFHTLEQHNEALVDNINEVVAKGDVLYHLGDWSFGGEDKICQFYEQLHCENIHLILGNHDHHIERNPNRYPFLSVQHYKEITIAKQQFILSHYAFRVWNHHHKGSIHLYGHSHGSLPQLENRSMDVGVDTNNLMPYNINDILKIMYKRPVHVEDHHNSKTT